MNVFKKLRIIWCNLFGCIYSEKKITNNSQLVEMWPDVYKDPRVGAYVADLSKPCHRCGRMAKEDVRGRFAFTE